MTTLNRNSPRYREQLWDKCATPGSGYVFCNLCGCRVFPGELWVESHIGVPKAHDGNTVGIAHKRCNDLDNNTFVTPFIAKTKRLRRRHLGIAGPGLGITPLPAGRESKVSKKLNGEVVPRQPRYAKHHAAMAKRYPP